MTVAELRPFDELDHFITKVVFSKNVGYFQNARQWPPVCSAQGQEENLSVSDARRYTPS
jgi:hypothetical protein